MTNIVRCVGGWADHVHVHTYSRSDGAVYKKKRLQLLKILGLELGLLRKVLKTQAMNARTCYDDGRSWRKENTRLSVPIISLHCIEVPITPSHKV